MSLTLEDFAFAPEPSQKVPPDTVSRAQLESEKSTAYENGYQAGFDDAAQAEAKNQERIRADLARNLQELSFTFHEARAHVTQAMEPLLVQLLETVLPQLARETLITKILEELQPMVDQSADSPVELMVCPADLVAMRTHSDQFDQANVKLVEEPTLAEGQVFLRIGKIEKQIDISGAIERISQAVQALYDLNERTLKHG